MAASKGGGPAIGIDLGTTYSCVAVWRHDRGKVIANDQGNRLTPSCVAFTRAERLVGEAAVNQAALNPTNTIFGENELLHTSCFIARLSRLVYFLLSSRVWTRWFASQIYQLCLSS